jgi:hypothetical protein
MRATRSPGALRGLTANARAASEAPDRSQAACQLAKERRGGAGRGFRPPHPNGRRGTSRHTSGRTRADAASAADAQGARRRADAALAADVPTPVDGWTRLRPLTPRRRPTDRRGPAADAPTRADGRTRLRPLMLGRAPTGRRGLRRRSPDAGRRVNAASAAGSPTPRVLERRGFGRRSSRGNAPADGGFGRRTPEWERGGESGSGRRCSGTGAHPRGRGALDLLFLRAEGREAPTSRTCPGPFGDLRVGTVTGRPPTP